MSPIGLQHLSRGCAPQPPSQVYLRVHDLAGEGHAPLVMADNCVLGLYKLDGDYSGAWGA